MRTAHVFLLAAVAGTGFFAGRALRPASAPVNPDTATLAERHVAFRSRITAMMKGGSSSWTGVMALATRAEDTDDWIALLDSARVDPFLSEAIVRRWADADPEACWEHLLTLGDGNFPPEHLAKVSMKAWAARNPEDAVAALAAAPATEKADIAVRGALGWLVVHEALANDMERGFGLMPLPFSGGSFGSGSIDPWMEVDPGKACRLIASLPVGYVFQHKLGPAARVWFRKEPEAAMQWIGTLPQDLQRKALGEISEELEETGDVNRSRDLALSVDSMAVRQSIASPYLQHLRRTDPAAACAWAIENFDGRMMGSVMGNIVGNVDLKEFPPTLFLSYFDQMPEGVGKGEAAGRLIQKWLSMDGPAAIAWGESLNPRSREDVLGDLVEDWARMPESHAWLATAPDTPFSRRVLGRIVETMNDPEKARAWARELPPARAAQVAEALERMAAKEP